MVWKVANIVELDYGIQIGEGKFERYLGDRSTGLDDPIGIWEWRRKMGR